MREIKFRQWVTSPGMEERNLGPYPYMEHNLNFHGNVNKVFANNGKQDGTMVIYYMQFTGIKDKNGVEIYEGDITELIVSGNDRRRFVVSIEKVVREVVNHPDFAGPSSKVEIMGVVFKWEGYELFPMLDENGRSDVSRMRVIGNIYENPELIKGS